MDYPGKGTDLRVRGIHQVCVVYAEILSTRIIKSRSTVFRIAGSVLLGQRKNGLRNPPVRMSETVS